MFLDASCSSSNIPNSPIMKHIYIYTQIYTYYIILHHIIHLWIVPTPTAKRYNYTNIIHVITLIKIQTSFPVHFDIYSAPGENWGSLLAVDIEETEPDPDEALSSAVALEAAGFTATGEGMIPPRAKAARKARRAWRYIQIHI